MATSPADRLEDFYGPNAAYAQELLERETAAAPAAPVAAELPTSPELTTSALPVRRPGASRLAQRVRSSDTPFFGEQPAAAKAEPQQQQQPQQQAQPEGGRSLFEAYIPPEEAPPQPPGQTAAGSFVPPGPFGPGSAMPLPGGGAPSPEFQIKASVTAQRYCTPESPQFGRTVAEVWFRTAADAERVGFRPVG